MLWGIWMSLLGMLCFVVFDRGAEVAARVCCGDAPSDPDPAGHQCFNQWYSRLCELQPRFHCMHADFDSSQMKCCCVERRLHDIMTQLCNMSNICVISMQYKQGGRK